MSGCQSGYLENLIEAANRRFPLALSLSKGVYRLITVMDFFAYILKCSDDSFYTGHTDNLEQRVAQHQSGFFTGYTYKRRPVELVWSENFPTRYEALEAEKRIKGWTRAKKQALIDGDWDLLCALARNRSDR